MAGLMGKATKIAVFARTPMGRKLTAKAKQLLSGSGGRAGAGGRTGARQGASRQRGWRGHR